MDPSSIFRLVGIEFSGFDRTTGKQPSKGSVQPFISLIMTCYQPITPTSVDPSAGTVAREASDSLSPNTVMLDLGFNPRQQPYLDKDESWGAPPGDPETKVDEQQMNSVPFGTQKV